MIHQFRAVPTATTDLENDPDVMVHQQLARLRFFEKRLSGRESSILEFGCGSGFNCAYLKERNVSGHICGFDLSEPAVVLARERYEGLDFRVADACDATLDLGLGAWDVVVSFEVLEHVPNMPVFLQNIRRHLKQDGLACISTPNRTVFSLGHEPSPVNLEHLKELTLEEFEDLLRPHFTSIEIFGQRFRTKSLLDAWERDVQEKIKQLQEGTRWIRPRTASNKLRELAVLNKLYDYKAIRAAWRFLRWDLIARYEAHQLRRRRRYSFQDFEFTSDDLSQAVWFCAIVRP